MTPADLAPDVQRLVPIVQAMKEYQALNGQLPKTDQDLLRWFINKKSNKSGLIPRSVSIYNGRLHYRYKYGTIIYHFPPEREGWEIDGSTMNGNIPAPIVTLSPTTRPISELITDQ